MLSLRGRPLVLSAAMLAAASISSTSFRASANDPAAAESLFREAQDLLAHGDVVRGCAKLEESQRLDATGATALALARCLEAQGKTASAWARYQESLDYARKKGASARVREITERIAAIEPQLAKVVIHVADSVATIPGIKVTRAGQEVGSAQWNSAVPVDPGSIPFTASAPGRITWALDVAVLPSSTATVTIPELFNVPAPPPDPSASTAEIPPSAAPSASSPPMSASAEPRTDTAVLGCVGVGAGVVGVALGTYFLLRHGSLSDQATALCASSSCGKDNHDSALEKSDEAGRAGTLSIVSYSGGAVLAALGTYLLLRPSTTNAAFVPWFDKGTAGGHLEARF